MGQQISKRLVVPKLTNAMKQYESEAVKDAISDISRRQAIAKAKGQKYIDPSAQSGFKRDTWNEDEGFIKEVHQRDFLKSQQEGVEKEMPKDLVDFLNDAGPLQRQVSKDLTSGKVYDSLLEEDEHRRQLQEEARQRKRRRMPMIENLRIGGEDDASSNINSGVEGLTVERTTNFSDAVKEEESEHDLRLSDKELFDLVWKIQKKEITIEQYLLEEKKLDMNAQLQQQEEGQTRLNDNMRLLKNMNIYYGVPIIMQDADQGLIGVPEHNVEALKLENIRLAPGHIQLSFTAESIQDKLRRP